MDSVISWFVLCAGAIVVLVALVRALPQPPQTTNCKLQGSYKLDY